jgi:hypothetical protein
MGNDASSASVAFWRGFENPYFAGSLRGFMLPDLGENCRRFGVAHLATKTVVGECRNQPGFATWCGRVLCPWGSVLGVMAALRDHGSTVSVVTA